jgi:threonine 3-dehydrogenase
MNLFLDADAHGRSRSDSVQQPKSTCWQLSMTSVDAGMAIGAGPAAEIASPLDELHRRSPVASASAQAALMPATPPPIVAAIFDPFGNAVHTALSFPVLGEDVLITGAGPIGIMSIPVVQRAGARHVVITDLNPSRLELARKMGATLAVNPIETPLAEVQKQLKMAEGFDVGLEMSGSPQGLSDLIANMSHGGKIAILGIPAKSSPMDWRPVIFNMLTIKGIYGREMYETWYKMSVLLEAGLDISPVITHRFSYDEFEKGFAAMKSGQAGKVILDWTKVR